MVYFATKSAREVRTILAVDMEYASKIQAGARVSAIRSRGTLQVIFATSAKTDLCRLIVM
jgi:hypothetical protein